MKRLLVATLAAALIVVPACGEEAKTQREVLLFLSDTEALSREFTYSERTKTRAAEITGALEDSYRFRELLRLEGTDVMEQVVDDDTLAVRIIDPSKIPVFSLTGELTGSFQIVVDAMRSGQWVVDPSGAPPIHRLTQAGQVQVGLNPFQDAVQVIRYVRTAITQAFDVKEFQEGDLSPAYRPSEDPFPKPDDAAGERRFDLVRPILPRPAQAGGGGGVAFPTAANYRKMAIFVKGRRVVRVLEDVDVEGHEEYDEARREGSRRLLEQLEAVLAGRGGEKVRPRQMSVVFESLGGKISVRSPGQGLQAGIRQLILESGYGGLFTPEAAGLTGQTAEPSPGA